MPGVAVLRVGAEGQDKVSKGLGQLERLEQLQQCLSRLYDEEKRRVIGQVGEGQAHMSEHVHDEALQRPEKRQKL